MYQSKLLLLFKRKEYLKKDFCFNKNINNLIKVYSHFLKNYFKYIPDNIFVLKKDVLGMKF